jgi:predicted phage-related endonuclease
VGISEVVNQNDRSAWLEARKNYLCSSEVAGALGESEYVTREQLLLEKAGLADERRGDERMDLSLALEPFVAEQAKLKYGWTLVPHGTLTVDAECPHLAATPDFTMWTPWGDATVQVKVTASKPWDQVKKHSFAPPLMYQLQVQAECAVLGCRHGVLLVLHLLPLSLRAYYVPRHDKVIGRIRNEAVRFMSEVAAIKEGRIAV